MDLLEERLTGGNVAVGVIRIGDTVRKPATPATDAIEAFLNHLESVGFSGAPRTLGRDDQNRHVLEYIPGVIAHDQPPMPLDALRRIGTLIRDLHDASESFQPPASAAWDVAIRHDRHDLICHHDLAPWNLVIDGDRWVFIDWDGAGPGSRMWDLAYAAHGFVVFRPNGDPDVDAARLATLVESYGLDEEQRQTLPQMIVDRTRAMFDLLQHGARTGQQPWARLQSEGHADHWGPTADYIERHLTTWHRALM
jgi:Ser/Thr protein kinase RdoA (MazF antagonist)